LRGISRSGEHAALLTRQLLTFSRKKAVRVEVTDVREVVTGLQEILSRLVGDPIAIHVSVGDEPALVLADANAIEQIIFNLSLNARDAIERQGTIGITVETVTSHADPDAGPEPRVRLIVEDDGCGMGAETLQHIFEPFFTTKDSDRGTGLGLATVQGLVRDLGGRIEVDSELGRGSRFLVELAAASQKAQEGDVGATAAPLGRGEVVLLVEDHVLARHSLEQTLIRNGYRLVTANDGAEALDVLAHRDDVRVILSDISMPRMSGDQLLEELRRRGRATPVIFLSGYPQAAGNLTLEDVPVLAKPVSTDLLLRTLRRALDGLQEKPLAD
jgi:CheY-like chemotaxis protein